MWERRGDVCRDIVRWSRNITINVVLQCTFCVNFARFNMAALQKISCPQITNPSFSRPTLLCFGCFSSNHITGKRYPEIDMDRTGRERLLPREIFPPPNLHSYQIQDGGLNTKMCTRASKIRLHCRLPKCENKFYSAITTHLTKLRNTNLFDGLGDKCPA